MPDQSKVLLGTDDIDSKGKRVIHRANPVKNTAGLFSGGVFDRRVYITKKAVWTPDYFVRIQLQYSYERCGKSPVSVLACGF